MERTNCGKYHPTVTLKTLCSFIIYIILEKHQDYVKGSSDVNTSKGLQTVQKELNSLHTN